MARILLIGTNNRDKASELRRLLAATSWEVKGLDAYPSVPPPVEDADTFEGNAFLKARYFVRHHRVPCVSDDSGIEVDALDGEPGVYSARYAGENCTYDDNNQKMLKALGDIPDSERSARFVCFAAFVDTNGAAHAELGTVEGRIAHEIRGNNGFGYDPIFIPSGYDKTFGEMDPGEKQSISHRGKAFRKLCIHLESIA